MRCLAKDVDAFLKYYGVPKDHLRFIRTNNLAERLFNVRKSGTVSGFSAVLDRFPVGWLVTGVEPLGGSG